MVKALNYGRLGNSHWQNAVAIVYALRHGLEFTVPNTTNDSYWNPIYLQNLVNPNWNPNLPSVQLNEPHFHYAPIPFDESFRSMNVILNGYWQSWNFLSGYEKEIIELFNYPWHLEAGVCSIHARFSDYLSIQGKHILVDRPYLETAISIIKREKNIHRFKVFSDDLRYFRENFGSVYGFEYSTNTDIIEDLVEISCCHSQINSSSTFSWWSAFLNRNPDKMVITNSQWFQEGWKDDHGVVDTSDVIPEEWVKISTI